MGQSASALGTAAGKHLAAVFGRHSLSEAMLLGALEFLGLIGTEHPGTPPVNESSASGRGRRMSESTAAQGGYPDIIL